MSCSLTRSSTSSCSYSINRQLTRTFASFTPTPPFLPSSSLRTVNRHNSTSSKPDSTASRQAANHQTHLFKQLCEVEAISVPFERRVAAAKVSLAQSAIMDTYVFPDYRLKRTLDDPSKTPLLLVACGSFSPNPFALAHVRHGW